MQCWLMRVVKIQQPNGKSAPNRNKLRCGNLALSEFYTKFKNHTGKFNILADALSHPEPEVVANQAKWVLCDIISFVSCNIFAMLLLQTKRPVSHWLKYVLYIVLCTTNVVEQWMYRCCCICYECVFSF